jgi:hypothetical protein
MEWKKKKSLIWSLFVVFSITAIIGAAVPVLFVIGMLGLACVMGYCMID